MKRRTYYIMHQKRTILSVMLLAALLFSLNPTGFVYADGEEPTTQVAAGEPVGETTTEVATEEPIVETTPEVVNEEPTAEPTEEVPAQDVTAEPTVSETEIQAESTADPVEKVEVAEEQTGETVIEVMEALAENEVTLVNETGEPLQLASVESEQAIDLADPWFEYNGEIYRFFQDTNACTLAGYTTNCVDGTSTPIQDAIDRMNTLDDTQEEAITLHVEAGTFAEYFYIDRNNLTLSGPNAGVDPNTGTRAAEAVLTIGMTPVDWTAYGWGIFQEVFGVEGDNVIVDGFTVQGDATTGATQEILVDAMDAQNLILRNNIFRGTSGDLDHSYGVYVYKDSDSTTTTTVENNYFENIDVANVLVSNSYGSVNNNVMQDVKVGVQTNTEYYDSSADDSIEIANNVIHASRYGIWHNAMGPNGTQTALIHDNVIYGLAPDTVPSYGIYITSMAGTSTVLVEDNTVDGTNYGIGVWNAVLGSTNLINNVLKNNKVGIILDNDSYPVERGMTPSGRPGDVTVTGGQIINSSEYGLVVRDNQLNVSEGALTINATGVMLINVACIAHTEGDEAYINISNSTFQDCGDCENGEWTGINNQYTTAPVSDNSDGTTTLTSGLLIPVTGSGLYMLGDPSSDVTLSGGDFIRYSGLVGYWAGLAYLSQDELPAALPDGYTFLTGMASTLIDPYGDPVSELPSGAEMLGSFMQQNKAADQEFAILYWDAQASAWVELEITLSGDFVQFASAQLAGGTFVLVAK